MRHLVTGGSGFIGNLVARRLLDRGEKVRVIDIWSDPTRPAAIEFIEGSVVDPRAVAAAMEGVDVVHHNAALVAQTDAGSDFWKVNVEGSRIVAEAAVDAKVGAMIHISSTAVYGMPPEAAITASTPMRPFEPYGRSKLAGEQAMDEICSAAGVPLITIRPRATLGAGRLGIFELLFDWIARNRRVYIAGDGSNRMQLIHAHDLMDFYMLALDAGRPGTYNVGAPQFGTMREDIETLIDHARSGSRVTGLPAPLVVNALRALHFVKASPFVPWHYYTSHLSCHFDVAPLLAMGWQPAYSNARMLCESYDWYRLTALDKLSAQSAHRSALKRGFLRFLEPVS